MLRNIRYRNSHPKRSPVTERRLGGKCFLSDSAQTKIDYFWKPRDVCVKRSLDLEVCQATEIWPNPSFGLGLKSVENQSNPFESNLKTICTWAHITAGDSRLTMKSKNKSKRKQTKCRAGENPTRQIWTNRGNSKTWPLDSKKIYMRKRASLRNTHLTMTMEARASNACNASHDHVKANESTCPEHTFKTRTRQYNRERDSYLLANKT